MKYILLLVLLAGCEFFAGPPEGDYIPVTVCIFEIKCRVSSFKCTNKTCWKPVNGPIDLERCL